MRRRTGRPGLLGLAARTAVVAGTANAVSGSMHARQADSAKQAADAQAFRDQQAAVEHQAAMQAAAAQAVAQHQAAAPPPPPQPTVAAVAGDEMIAQLERLGALRQSGILTDEEFAAQKARILGG
ncbi:MAG: SHOCT domain-containing protein [Terracoccus sp.]